jgi:hypothetical protein
MFMRQLASKALETHLTFQLRFVLVYADPMLLQALISRLKHLVLSKPRQDKNLYLHFMTVCQLMMWFIIVQRL